MKKKVQKRNKIINILLGIVIILGFGIGGIIYFTGGTGATPNALASVNGEYIYNSENSEFAELYQRYLNYYQTQIPNLTPEMQNQIAMMALRNFVDELLIYQSAVKSNLNVSMPRLIQKMKESPSFYDKKGNFIFFSLDAGTRVRLINQYKKALLQNSISTDIGLSSVLFTENEIKEYYTSKFNLFKIGFYFISKKEVNDDDLKTFYIQTKKDYVKMKAAHILVADEVKAQEIYAQLVTNPELWKEFVAKYSTDEGSKVNNGDLGEFDKNQMVKEFSDAAFAMTKANQISAPVKSQFGYHIIKCIEPSYAPDFNTIKDSIKEKYLTLNAAKMDENSKANANKLYEALISNSVESSNLIKKYGISYLLSNEFSFRSPVFDEANKEQYNYLTNDEFYLTLLKLKENMYSIPISLDEGYVIVKLLKKTDASTMDFAEMKASVLRDFIALQESVNMKEYNTYLKNTAKIKYFFNTSR